MATIKVPKTAASFIIDGDGKCWAKVGPTNAAPTAVAGVASFTACTDCETSPCGGADPSMMCTVFDSDYAGGNIGWVGETWTPAEVVAGATKEVCPTLYARSISTYASGFSTRYFGNTWQIAGLSLRREGATRTIGSCTLAEIGLTGSYFIRLLAGEGAVQVNHLAINPTPIGLKQDRRAWVFGQPCTGPTPITNFSTLNLILTVGNPRSYDYLLTDAFFGSHLSGGITYTWAKGLGW